MPKWMLCSVALVVFGLSGAAPALAQNAQITGTVRDASGGVIPGATVTARNQDTGLVRTAVTDHLGGYRLPALPPGTYLVTTELIGFATETRPDILLVIDQTAILNVTIRPATVEETITVTGEAPIVDTTRSDVSTSVSTAQIQDLPVASRRWIDLALLVPGTSQDNIRDRFYRGNVNIGAGTREYSNMFIVDGVNNTWAEMGEARQNFAMDSIREFKVSTSNYKAEHGLATGGLLTVVSKSGTNEVHGSGLLFFRDKALTTATFFEDEKPDFRRYQYGGSIGGPIVRDKTHFFFAYERTDEQQYFTVSTRGVWPQHDGTYLSDQWRWTYTAKVDHQISAGQSLFVRYARENEYRPIVTAGGTTAPSASFDFAVPRDSAVVAHTWVMSDRALNDFRFQYGFSKYILSPPFSNGNWGPGDFPDDRVGLFTPEFRYPSISVGSANTQMGPERRWQFKNDFSYLIPDWGGSHQWKFGVDYNYITFQADGSGGTAGNWTFPKDEPYNPNDRSTWPTQYTDRLPDYGDVPVHWLSTYIQDDWRPARGLTINLGLRWDLQRGTFNEGLYEDLLPRVEKKLGPGSGVFPLPIPFHERDPITGSPFSARGDWNNFGPRIGLAWDPGSDGRNNLHAGYGMFYENIRTLTTSFGEIRWPQAKTVIIRNPSFPDPYEGRSREQFITTAPPNISVLSNDFVNAYAHQFNVGFTRMVSRNLAASVDLTWVDRYSDRDIIDINLPDPVTRQRPYPQFNRVSYSQSSSDNTYKALLVKVEKRLADNYQFMVSYTLSKATDSAVRNVEPDFYGFRRVKSPGVADRRHRLVLSSIVQLPLDVQLSGIADFRTSLPFNPRTSFDLNGDGYTGDLPPGVAYVSGCRNLNVDAINALRASRRLSSVSADSIACPQFMNFDIRLSKIFRIRGSQRLEVITQLFNIFDRANFAPPVSNPTGALFGQVTNLPSWINAPSRQVELAVRYHF